MEETPSYTPESIELAKSVVVASIERRLNADEEAKLKILTEKRDEVAERFAEVIAKAKEGDPGALGKLRQMYRTTDTGLGMRLALMNRAQRQAFASGLKHEKADRQRAKDKAKARKKARRR